MNIKAMNYESNLIVDARYNPEANDFCNFAVEV